MLFTRKYYRFLVATIFVLLIIYLATLVPFIFQPLVIIFQTLFIPFLIAGVLFYLLRPIVSFLHNHKFPKPLAILTIFLALIGIITGLVFLVGPTLQEQVMNLVDNLPGLINELNQMLVQAQNHPWVEQFQETDNFSLEEIGDFITENIADAAEFIAGNIASFIGAVASALITAVVIPFILFFLLKDGHKAPDQVLRFLPEKQKKEGKSIVEDMDGALSAYIQGQIIVSFCVGVLMYIAFLIIGLEYSLILALVAMFTNVIPFIGPWIGAIPAAIVALIDSPITFLWVALAIVIVQQIESNLITPKVMGKKLHLHPLTVILLLLVAGRFGGLLALILAIPTYAVTKVVVSHMYRLFKLREKIDDELNGDKK
ncbi:AI-2E family transporter [Evansella sp. LMS18]|uniref:AI-2E family transporter n=1 Tax=Evansella sp. LMS18 TaxID=2924033 RepID=UPI0020D0093B|nr:AI-2E family transporter [Evansella sp. LMS18]UTR11175.1 AI-2E family transporter [Evansella sp. LMS18]